MFWYIYQLLISVYLENIDIPTGPELCPDKHHV